MVRLWLTAGLAGVLAVGAGGCTRIRDTQGYVVDEELLAAVAPGVDNRDSVTKTLGRPTLTTEFGGERWYYLQRKTSQLAFLTPEPVEQRILVVEFDSNGTVSKVERRGMEQVASISPEGDKTPTLGRETGLLEDLFGNIGRFGGTNPGPDASGPQ